MVRLPAVRATKCVLPWKLSALDRGHDLPIPALHRTVPSTQNPKSVHKARLVRLSTALRVMAHVRVSATKLPIALVSHYPRRSQWLTNVKTWKTMQESPLYIVQ